jgi:hypothetical protein
MSEDLQYLKELMTAHWETQKQIREQYQKDSEKLQETLVVFTQRLNGLFEQNRAQNEKIIERIDQSLKLYASDNSTTRAMFLNRIIVGVFLLIVHHDFLFFLANVFLEGRMPEGVFISIISGWAYASGAVVTYYLISRFIVGFGSYGRDY